MKGLLCEYPLKQSLARIRIELVLQSRPKHFECMFTARFQEAQAILEASLANMP